MRIEKKHYYMIPYTVAQPHQVGVMEIITTFPISSFDGLMKIMEIMRQKNGNSTLIISGAPYLLRVDKKFKWN
jgi:hypothetical protein